MIEKIKNLEGITITQTGKTYIIEIDEMYIDMGIETDALEIASEKLGLPIENGRIILNK